MSPSKRRVLKPFALCAAVLASCCTGLAEPEMHLIPKGYTGNVFIIYAMDGGEPAAHEGIFRMYRIPSSGVLATRGDLRHGWTWSRYFYMSPDGQRQRITGYWPSTVAKTAQNRSDPEIGIFFPRSGAIRRADHPCEVAYAEYFVGTKRQLMEMKEGDERLIRYLHEHPVCSNSHTMSFSDVRPLPH
jgi:hypothetical protein